MLWEAWVAWAELRSRRRVRQMADLSNVLRQIEAKIKLDEDLLADVDDDLDQVFNPIREQEDEPDEGEEEATPPEEETVPEELPPEEAEAEPSPEDMGGGDPTPDVAGADTGMGDIPGGMPGEEKPKTAEEIGRIYELKKIYSRLISMESYLSDTSDITLIKLRSYVSHSINLFETLISNVDSFKENVNEIIVMYYSFLERIYEILQKYYNVKEEEEKSEK